MRKIRQIRRGTAKPLPIIRFDNPENLQFLIQPAFKRPLHFNPSLLQKHAEILQLSAAQANSVCLAANQIGLESQSIAIHSPIKHCSNQELLWIN